MYTNSVFILQIALNEIASVQLLVLIYTTKSKYLIDTTNAEPTPISQRLKPTIIIFIKVEIFDGVKEFTCFIIFRLVSMIKSLTIP